MGQTDVIRVIEQADDFLMCEIMKAVIRRYTSVFPDWEVMFLSIHKRPGGRERDIDAHICFLENMKKKDSLG